MIKRLLRTMLATVTADRFRAAVQRNERARLELVRVLAATQGGPPKACDEIAFEPGRFWRVERERELGASQGK